MKCRFRSPSGDPTGGRPERVPLLFKECVYRVAVSNSSVCGVGFYFVPDFFKCSHFSLSLPLPASPRSAECCHACSGTAGHLGPVDVGTVVPPALQRAPGVSCSTGKI